MKEYTDTAKRIIAASDDPKKDAPAKRVLMSKLIIAHILKDYVEEFYDVSVDDIINKCIENVSYGEVPVDNNAAPEFIKGLANEDKSTSGDDLITYDVLLEVATLLSEQIGIIVNVEPHNRDNGRLPYSIINRARYYVARLVSAQKGRYFVKSDYNSIRKVYSIWIIMTPNEGKNTVTKYEETPKCIVGNYTEPNSSPLTSIIMIRLGKIE